MKIRRFSDARTFLDRAESWLLSQEAENNVVLGIANRLLRNDHPWENPIYLATVETNSQIAGCAWRTPPHKLGLTRLPIASIPLLVDDVGEVYSDLPAVLGPEAEATEFARSWTRGRDSKWSVGIRQRIFSLERVIAPKRAAEGALRNAGLADLPLVAEWGAGFARECGLEEFDPIRYSERSIHDGSLYLWEHREIRSMAAVVDSTPNGVRIGYVYTPPSLRGHGYATAAVASLSQSMLDAGRRFCSLFADLANPTSNAIYQRIGYQPVTDVVDVHIR